VALERPLGRGSANAAINTRGERRLTIWFAHCRGSSERGTGARGVSKKVCGVHARQLQEQVTHLLIGIRRAQPRRSVVRARGDRRQRRRTARRRVGVLGVAHVEADVAGHAARVHGGVLGRQLERRADVLGIRLGLIRVALRRDPPLWTLEL
jgi:hypothetical protein